MKSLGGCPPWAVLHEMIDAADSDRNGEVFSNAYLLIAKILTFNLFLCEFNICTIYIILPTD